MEKTFSSCEECVTTTKALYLCLMHQLADIICESFRKVDGEEKAQTQNIVFSKGKRTNCVSISIIRCTQQKKGIYARMLFTKSGCNKVFFLFSPSNSVDSYLAAYLCVYDLRAESL